MRLFLFAIGGTGARVVRSLTMMLASGIDGLDSSTEIIPIIIDYDLSNGDKTRAIKALESYSNIHHNLYPDGRKQGVLYDNHFFMTRITSLSQAGVATMTYEDRDFEFNFGPIGNNIKFADYLNVSGMDTNPALSITKDLLNALYDDSDVADKNAELNLNLAKGFKGNPNIGSVVFHGLSNKPEFRQFVGTFDAAQDRIFIVSSIFGGTGSSGFPEIVNTIRNSTRATLQPAIMGASIILPYFDLQQFHPEKGDTGAIDAGAFNAKTRAALSYYALPDGINTKVNAMYYVGDENHDAYQYNEGEERQKNDSHVVEFVAATSIIDFMKRSITYMDHKAYEFCIKDAKINESIQLTDFHDSTHRLVLDNLSTFAIAMKFYRDALCGDRERIAHETAFYRADRFNLSAKLGRGVYQELDDFLSASEDVNDWGFYKWLSELLKHSHKLYLYSMERSQPMKNILSYKVIQNQYGPNPIKDSKLCSEINEKSRNLPQYNDTAFFKVLREVAAKKYNSVK